MSVTFEDVRFGYEASYSVLKGVSFHIRTGRMVALAGHTGAGKRSCARLLQRLWDPELGSVRISDVDVRDLPPATLRERVACVPRDCDLRPATVLDNLRLARPDATFAGIEAAAQAAQVDEAILRLPQGYETPHDIWRAQLSTGERQRIALARAALSQAPILILDEATDPLSMADVLAWQKAVSHIRRGRTVLLISHRLSTLRMANAIVVIEQGVVVEEGRHDHLVAWNDRYARLIASQTLRE